MPNRMYSVICIATGIGGSYMLLQGALLIGIILLLIAGLSAFQRKSFEEADG